MLPGIFGFFPGVLLGVVLAGVAFLRFFRRSFHGRRLLLGSSVLAVGPGYRFMLLSRLFGLDGRFVFKVFIHVDCSFP